MENGLDATGTLYIVGVCGVAGVLVDLDHFISLIVWRYVNPGITAGRLWHTPVFIITGGLICYLVSRVGGLYGGLVLSGVSVVTVLVLIKSKRVVWRLHG